MSDIEIDSSRRSFFSSLFRKTTDLAVRVADVQHEVQKTSWIRPPFALDELEFLSVCTHCDACIEACPHGTIVPLSSQHGVMVAGTPVLDLQNKACHLCADWPCVTACEPGALKLPVREEEVEAQADQAPLPMPRMAEAAIDTLSCLPHNGPECGACAASCPVPGALVWTNFKPYIVPQLCTGCALCREACITEPKSVVVKAFWRKPIVKTASE